MPQQKDIALMAHLMRRAGFGDPRQELETRTAKGYEMVVEELLHPEDQPAIDEELMYRVFPGYEGAGQAPINQADWVFRMVNTKRPLEEKMALFWHQLFATGNSKVDNPPELTRQISMFREHGLGKFGDLLVELAKSPAMIFWLDNHGNHDGAINENWGRELLELFSLGAGNYSEDDIQAASRAFTGWTIGPKIPRNPLGRFFWNFEYKAEDHDEGEKTFLGHTGNLNGEDIVAIIVDQPASSRFLARHLYRFFVADEPQVSNWNITPPNDLAAIQTLVDAYDESHGDIRSILRVLFNSDFFKNARFARVKSPAELIVGTVRMAGNYDGFRPGYNNLAIECAWQGQELLNPPSVEGWHTGSEWIDAGGLLRRVNFASGTLGDTSLPGVRAIIDRIRSKGNMPPKAYVGACLELLGSLRVNEATYIELMTHAMAGGDLTWDTPEEVKASEKTVGKILTLIAASRDYQFA
ncbi:MAG: DUF1800 domain-containing protein [Chloroflexi bacterium]|nr:DUF1800 domain-containing protein [Chloroflexota bacterium]MDA1271924.1 DUF1800 domain-containing protein [Chloroflexota bacterium]